MENPPFVQAEVNGDGDEVGHGHGPDRRREPAEEPEHRQIDEADKSAGQAEPDAFGDGFAIHRMRAR